MFINAAHVIEISLENQRMEETPLSEWIEEIRVFNEQFLLTERKSTQRVSPHTKSSQVALNKITW